ncbi:MAG: 30S ribosomal protein S12 methylthiotransferase RimO [Deltaproteobacteria bacterium]|nr:30S ribosomal protein S12 methylthiotransferase RimO [Deltaproteobacteria bacterium]
MSNRFERTVYYATLGCPKNLVDTERMAAILQESGFRWVPSPEQAELILVNTCSFIEPAVRESAETILELAEYKKTGQCKALVVAGCLFSRFGGALKESLPEVDLFVGTDEFQTIGKKLLESGLAVMEREESAGVTTGRFRSTPPFTSYLKIAEGCDNACTFCLIPSLRGPYRSVLVEDLLREAGSLSAEGVVELNVVAQDTTRYGEDLESEVRLPGLMERLARVGDFRWIRALYLYPERVADELLDVVAANERLLPYFDLPLQHVSEPVLKRMGRWRPSWDPYRLIDRIRDRVPDAVIRLTVMVGFPGETTRDYDELVQFIDRVRPEHVGGFTFYPEEGVPAARLPDQVPRGERERRLEGLMQLQADISRAKNSARIGSDVTILVEGRSDEYPGLLEGRAWWHAPEIDGAVFFQGKAGPGEWVRVRITKASEHDLFGRMIDRL